VAKKEQLWCVSHIINLIIKALIYGKGISKLKCLMISVSEHIKFNLIQQRGSVGKVYNIVKYCRNIWTEVTWLRVVDVSSSCL